MRGMGLRRRGSRVLTSVPLVLRWPCKRVDVRVKTSARAPRTHICRVTYLLRTTSPLRSYSYLFVLTHTYSFLHPRCVLQRFLPGLSDPLQDALQLYQLAARDHSMGRQRPLTLGESRCSFFSLAPPCLFFNQGWYIAAGRARRRWDGGGKAVGGRSREPIVVQSRPLGGSVPLRRRIWGAPRQRSGLRVSI